MKKTLYERARAIKGGILESRMVARSDDLGRPLTDEETIDELRYLLDTIPYAGYGSDGTKMCQACRYLLKAIEK